MDTDEEESDSDSDDKMDVDQQDGNQKRRKKIKDQNSKSALQSNHEFWSEFLKKNLKYQTEPFGGNNPCFIPYVTNEQHY